jgi:hypothetical protein
MDSPQARLEQRIVHVRSSFRTIVAENQQCLRLGSRDGRQDTWRLTQRP